MLQEEIIADCPTAYGDDLFDWVALGRDRPQSEQFYWQMSLIRETERLLLRLFQDNKLFGTTHTCLGQEANAVGVVNALDRTRDTVWSNHRCHGHFLAYCGQVKRLLGEVMGRTGGACGGRGGSQHLSWAGFHSSGVQGGIVPLALGAALADRDRGGIATVFLGDGTMGEGVVYEGLNLAALWGLPVLFVVEDNGIAQTTPKRLAVSGSIVERARPFGIRCFSYAGADVLAIHALAHEAAGLVRSEGRPAWLCIETARLGPHSKGDDTRGEDEIARLWAQDPMTLHGERIPNRDQLEQQIAATVAEALDAAERMPVACAS
jgi:TPP-dependent pyruvate/acetoin dehydrogenase alpha subunit